MHFGPLAAETVSFVSLWHPCKFQRDSRLGSVTVLHGTPDKLQRVLNAAARVVTGTKKFERGLSRLLHTELHWLNVPERVTYTSIAS